MTNLKGRFYFVKMSMFRDFFGIFLINIKLLCQQMFHLHVMMHVSHDKFKLLCDFFIITTALISYTLDRNEHDKF